MQRSSPGQATILLIISIIFSLGYNGIRGDGLELIAEKEIVHSHQVSDVDTFLADTTVFMAPRFIDLELAKELYDRGVVFVDARDEEEFQDGHIAGALNGSVVRIASEVSKYDPLVAYCSGEGCNESLDLAEALMLDWGFTRIFVFEGGWPEWESAGYPSEEGM